MVFTKKFKQLNKKASAIAGGKGASLGEMTRAGIPVPPGFVVLAGAYTAFLERTDLSVEIDAMWDKINPDDMASVEHASEEIQDLIVNKEIPEDIAKLIFHSFEELSSEFVAVRSSATAEDSDTAAWAGQLESYLYVTKEDLLDKVRLCWASLFSPRAIFYRFEREKGRKDVAVAVVVQKMVNSEVSGVAFSVHPVTQDHDQLIAEAAWGLGEAIVQGMVTPDSYVVEKSSLNHIDVNVSEQEKMLVRAKIGIHEVDVPESKREKQKLSEQQIAELSELVIHIEKHYGLPQDIEWALEDDKLYIVQSRPITTLS